MSKPEIKDTLRHVRFELISASSSLHTPPDPVENPPEDAQFLDELDATAKHSLEHIQAATRSLSSFETKAIILVVETLKKAERKGLLSINPGMPPSLVGQFVYREIFERGV